MNPLTLLVVVVVSTGGAPGLLKRESEHHKVPLSVFKQATVTLYRVVAGQPDQMARTGGGKLTRRVAPGHYVIKAVANDTPGQTPNPACGSSRDRESFKPGAGFPVTIRPGTKRIHIQLECLRK